MENGRRYALVVGCNYPTKPCELRGRHNDALNMRRTLITRFGFDPNLITLLLDMPNGSEMPTGRNIKLKLNLMVDGAQPGDFLFFYFSGHGAKIETPFADAAIVPCDGNLIALHDLKSIANRLPEGTPFTIMADSDYSGRTCGCGNEGHQITAPQTLHAHPIANVSPHNSNVDISQQLLSLMGLNNITNIGDHMMTKFGSDASLMFRPPSARPLTLPNQVVILCGCRCDEYSHEVTDITTGQVVGAFSNAVQIFLKFIQPDAFPTTYEDVIEGSRLILLGQGMYKQVPCMCCSQEQAAANFLHQGARRP